MRDDISHSLTLINPHIHIGSFDRPNLFYGVKCIVSGQEFIKDLTIEVLKRCDTAESTIIYCATIRDAVKVYKYSHQLIPTFILYSSLIFYTNHFLTLFDSQVQEALSSAGVKTGLYHGKMEKNDRAQSHV